MKLTNSRLNSKLLMIFTFGLGLLFCAGLSQTESERGVSNSSSYTHTSSEDMRAMNDVMRDVPLIQSQQLPKDVDYSVRDPENAAEFESNPEIERFAMQIGLGGNPDVDNGKPFRDKSWNISILYPVKVTSVAGVPTTVYLEARCHALGQQPLSAQTDNNNIRCGPGVVTDVKVTNWLSTYGRLGIVTSRFSFNGAPRGQMNPKTGREFRLYPNDTWFTGGAIGAGIKIRVLHDTQIFGEYTKYLVQQTDNPAYQFRGGFTAGISRQFWLFQGPRN